MEFGNNNIEAIESTGNIDIKDAEIWEEPRTMFKDADMKNYRKSYAIVTDTILQMLTSELYGDRTHRTEI